MFLYRIHQLHPLTEQVTQLFLQPIGPIPFLYEAGQYIEVIHLDSPAFLSIACAPKKNGMLEFHLFHPKNNAKANLLLQSAKQKQDWGIKGPLGVCTVERLAHDKPIIFLARDTGFAPIKAIMEELILTAPQQTIHFYWSVSTPGDFYLADLLTEWSAALPHFTFTPILTRDFANKATMNTHLLEETVLRDHPDLTHYQVYASAPRPLIDAAWLAFAKQGLAKNCFFSDVFFL